MPERLTDIPIVKLRWAPQQGNGAARGGFSERVLSWGDRQSRRVQN